MPSSTSLLEATLQVSHIMSLTLVPPPPPLAFWQISEEANVFQAWHSSYQQTIPHL